VAGTDTLGPQGVAWKVIYSYDLSEEDRNELSAGQTTGHPVAARPRVPGGP